MADDFVWSDADVAGMQDALVDLGTPASTWDPASVPNWSPDDVSGMQDALMDLGTPASTWNPRPDFVLPNFGGDAAVSVVGGAANPFQGISLPGYSLPYYGASVQSPGSPVAATLGVAQPTVTPVAAVAPQGAGSFAWSPNDVASMQKALVANDPTLAHTWDPTIKLGDGTLAKVDPTFWSPRAIENFKVDAPSSQTDLAIKTDQQTRANDLIETNKKLIDRVDKSSMLPDAKEMLIKDATLNLRKLQPGSGRVVGDAVLDTADEGTRALRNELATASQASVAQTAATKTSESTIAAAKTYLSGTKAETAPGSQAAPFLTAAKQKEAEYELLTDPRLKTAKLAEIANDYTSAMNAWKAGEVTFRSGGPLWNDNMNGTDYKINWEGATVLTTLLAGLYSSFVAQPQAAKESRAFSVALQQRQFEQTKELTQMQLASNEAIAAESAVVKGKGPAARTAGSLSARYHA